MKIMYMNRDNLATGIGSWDWNFTGHDSTYHALYPRSWTVYEGNLMSHDLKNNWPIIVHNFLSIYFFYYNVDAFLYKCR